MKKAIQYLVVIGIGLVLKSISRIFAEGLKEAAKNNLVVSAVLLVIATVYLVVSYARHRTEIRDAATQALRIASEPGTTENDWAPFVQESKKRWKGNTLIVSAGISAFASFVGSLINAFLITDDSDLMWSSYPTPVIAVLLKLGWDHLEESRECREFENALRDANEGHWVPGPEVQDEDDSVKGQVRELIKDLPKEILDAAADSLKRE